VGNQSMESKVRSPDGESKYGVESTESEWGIKVWSQKYGVQMGLVTWTHSGQLRRFSIGELNGRS